MLREVRERTQKNHILEKRSKPSGGWKNVPVGEAHYPVALVCHSLGPDGGGEAYKRFHLYSFAQWSSLSTLLCSRSTLLFLNTELIVDLDPSLLFAPHPSFHPFLPPRLRGAGEGKKGCTGAGSLALRGLVGTI